MRQGVFCHANFSRCFDCFAGRLVPLLLAALPGAGCSGGASGTSGPVVAATPPPTASALAPPPKDLIPATPGPTAHKYGVATENATASRIAIGLLAKGGSAVDAAIAARARDRCGAPGIEWHWRRWVCRCVGRGRRKNSQFSIFVKCHHRPRRRRTPETTRGGRQTWRHDRNSRRNCRYYGNAQPDGENSPSWTLFADQRKRQKRFSRKRALESSAQMKPKMGHRDATLWVFRQSGRDRARGRNGAKSSTRGDAS